MNFDRAEETKLDRVLSPKEAKRRDYILNGSLWKVVLSITAPLAVYALFNYLYGFFDLILVSFIGADEVASVVFIDEIKLAISAIGGGIAAGGTVYVARHYGAGDFEGARKHAGSSLALAIGISSIVALITILFGKPLLGLLNAPAEIVATSIDYYYLQMASTVLIAVNSVYMGLEKAKGNTSTILVLNIIAMLIKLTLSAIFVLVLHRGTAYVALATLIAQGFLMVLAMFVMFDQRNSIGIRLKDMRIDKTIMTPIMALSIPVFAGKFLFSLGKVIVNSMAASYGTMAIAAFGIAMKLGGGPGSITQIFEESTTSIASQNLGGKKLKRAFGTYGVANLYAVFFGLAGMLLVVLSLDTMIPWFTRNADPTLHAMIADIFVWERYSMISSATIGIIAGVFLGFKITRVSLFLNVIRLYVFRIPALLLFMSLGIGSVSLGYIMFISNTGTMIIALLMIAFFYYRVRNYGYLDLRFELNR